jgi:putative flippase GtrA
MIKLIKNIIRYFLRFEFIRFGIVGVLNTIVDFGLLNILMFATKTNTGTGFIIIRTSAFICAVLVSFPLNKDWTFKDSNEEKRFKFFKFFIVTLVTLVINNILAGYLIEKNYFYLNQYL